MYWPFVHKRKSFEHENEIRVVHSRGSWGEDKTPPNGIWKPVSLEQLISRIYISPNSDQWFKELVERTTKRYGLEKVVQQSDINAAPLF